MDISSFKISSGFARQCFLLICLSKASLAWAFTHPGEMLSQDPQGLRFFTRERPNKLGSWSINPENDRQKSLGTLLGPPPAFAQDTLVMAYNQEWVVGLSFSRRTPRWFFKSPGGLSARPTIHENSVMLGCRDGSVHKLDLLSGTSLWSTRLDSAPSREFRVEGQRLLVVTASQSVYSLAYESGVTQWLFDGGSPDFLTIRSGAAPLVHKEIVLVGLASGEVLGLDLSSGKEHQRLNPDPAPSRFRDVVAPLSLLSDERLLIARSDGVLACLYVGGARQGSSCWEKAVHSEGITALSLGDGLLLAGTFNGSVVSYNPDNGQKLWQQDLGGTITSVTVTKNTIFSSSSTGRISALTSSGQYLWMDSVEGIISGPPQLIGDGLYYLTAQNVLYGYQP